MKIGIVGAGGIARAHTSAISAHPDAVLVGLHDSDAGRAIALAEQTGARTYQSAEELLQDVDGLIIASPNHTHHALATQAIRHGRHVLCEKPMTITLAEAEHLAALSIPADLAHAVGFNYRYLPIVQEVRRIIGEGTLGRVIFAELSLCRSSALTRTQFTWRDSDLGNATSGALGDLGVHLIDLLYFLFGSAIDTEACHVKRQTNVPVKDGIRVAVDDYSYISGVLHNGIYVNLIASKSSPLAEAGFSLKIIGAREELIYHSRNAGTYQRKSAVVWERCSAASPRLVADPPTEVHGWARTFHLQLAEWVDVAMGRRPRTDLGGISDGLRTQRVLDHFLASGPSSSYAQQSVHEVAASGRLGGINESPRQPVVSDGVAGRLPQRA